MTGAARQVADELNALGVPTQRQLEGRARGARRTRGLWRGGRIRNMVVNPLYKGERRIRAAQQEAARGHQRRGPGARVRAFWQAAQDALARHRICARNTGRVYLLKSVIVCGHCGHSYVGSSVEWQDWYRCDGSSRIWRQRRPLRRPQVRADSRARHLAGHRSGLRHPGDLLAELDGHHERDAEAARIEAESAPSVVVSMALRVSAARCCASVVVGA